MNESHEMKGKTNNKFIIVVLFLQVSWMRLRDINLLAINEVTNTKDKRIKAIHVPGTDLWSLRIQDTKLSDEGPYECQVTTDTQTATLVYLKVLGKLKYVKTTRLEIQQSSIVALTLGFLRKITK